MSAEQPARNFSVIVTEVGGVVVLQDDYDRNLTDLWVGVTLSLMIVTCIGLLCCCFLYNKFQYWKCQAPDSQIIERWDPEAGFDVESLPSYSIVTGLPSYAEAMEQLKQVKDVTRKLIEPTVEEIQQPTPSPVTLSGLSVTELLQFYRPPSFKN